MLNWLLGAGKPSCGRPGGPKRVDVAAVSVAHASLPLCCDDGRRSGPGGDEIHMIAPVLLPVDACAGAQ